MSIEFATNTRRGASGLPTHGDRTIGPLAARLGLDGDHAAAARRHAERLESRGELGAALDAWRIAMVIEPGVHETWRGLARCLRAAGHELDAEKLDRAADLIRNRSM